MSAPTSTPKDLDLPPSEGEHLRLKIVGMHCASYVTGIEDALTRTPGVLDATVSLGTETAEVDYLPAQADVAAIRQAIESRGYETGEDIGADSPEAESAERDREYRALLRKFWFGLAVSIPVMLSAYPSLVPGMRGLSPAGIRIVWIAAAALTLSVLVYSGGQFFTRGWTAIRHRSADMNTLISVGTGAAWVYSTVAVLMPFLFPAGTTDPFFDVAPSPSRWWCWDRRSRCARRAEPPKRSGS